MTQKQMWGVTGSLWVGCVLPVLRGPISCPTAVFSIRDSSQLSEIGTGKCSGPSTHFKHSRWATYLPSPPPLFSQNRGSCSRRQVPRRTVSKDTCLSHCCWRFFFDGTRRASLSWVSNLPHCQTVPLTLTRSVSAWLCFTNFGSCPL